MPRVIKRTLVILAAVVFGAGVLIYIATRAERRRQQPLPPERDATLLTLLELRETRLDETLWDKERLAQPFGRVLEDLWDRLNAASNKLAVAASFPIAELVLPQFRPALPIAHGIQLYKSTGIGRVVSGAEWSRFVGEWQGIGWELSCAEFRHTRFDTEAPGRPQQSRFFFAAHLSDIVKPARAVLEGSLVVQWAKAAAADGTPLIARIDATDLVVKFRQGDPAFRLTLDVPVTPPSGSTMIDPLILYDLNGDGGSEIILAAANLVARCQPDGLFAVQTLCTQPLGIVFASLVADFDGDAAADFLCAKSEGLFLVRGSPQGTFDGAARPVWSPQVPLRNPQVLTCGDIDADGDLDVWLGQYKPPYHGGQMPTPFYNANDGFPSYLLLNDGHGDFVDRTSTSGLEQKRWRRTYSASFTHLDSDETLDLVVVSDFAGVDLYKNDGRGRFKDMTRAWLAESRSFGMAHTMADFDMNGRLDLLVIGMNSPTADRLGHLKLVHPSASDAEARREMTFGNRLYLSRAQGRWEQTSLGDSLARSGWSWGCSAFDFDNDAFPDVYIATGHDSRPSVREYEPEFWLHDIYVANSRESTVSARYFDRKFQNSRSRGDSYGGYEKNRLYLNRLGTSFLEIGHLMGVALEECSRNVVADDLDGDGRVDLLVTTLETWPEPKQTLKFYRNGLKDGGDWIGVRLREQGDGISPVGARITVQGTDRSYVRQILTGDSYRSQHANTVHFGLGSKADVESVEVQWSNGSTVKLPEPALNRYHDVRRPDPF